MPPITKAHVILSCQAGQEAEPEWVVTREAIGRLREQHVGGIIMGCSELPLLQGESDSPDLLNPVQVLAEAAVSYAIASDHPKGLKRVLIGSPGIDLHCGRPSLHMDL